MKKISLFMLVFFMIITFSACSTENSDGTLTPTTELNTEVTTEPTFTEVLDNTMVNINQETLSSTTVTNGFEFSLFAMKQISFINDKYFYVNFKEINYNPVKNQLCVAFDYNDEDFENSTYYMIGREKGTLLTSQQLSYVVSSATGEHGGCFNFMTEETTYEILIGKIDQDDLNPSTHMEAVALIEFIDHNYDERDKVGLSTLIFENDIDYTYDKIPSVAFDITIEDPQEIIEGVLIKLYDDENNRLVGTYRVDSNHLKWISDKLVIDGYVIKDLAPYNDYLVKVFISGFNGIEGFSDVNVQNKGFTSQGITDSKGFRQHGFFAEVIEVIPGDTDATMHYIAVNDHLTVSKSDQEPYDFILKIYDIDDQLLFETIIDVSQETISIPMVHAQIGNIVKIVTDRDDIILHESIIESPSPKITIDAIENGHLVGYVTDGIDHINFISVLIFINHNDGHVDEVEISTFTTEGKFDILLPNYQDYQNADKLLVFYQINYGSLDDPQLHPREVWVYPQ